MYYYLICLGIVAFYLIFSYMLGDLFLRLANSEVTSASYRILIGFFCYFLLFQLICLPLKFTLQPLSLLANIWCVALLAVAGVYIALQRRSFKDKLNRCKLYFTRQNLPLLILCLLIVAQLLAINYNKETYALWDQAYYIGDISTSVYTDTISQYDPYTGILLKKLDFEYLLETYQNHSAVLCRLLGLAPLIETRTAEAFLIIILTNLIYYQFGMEFFAQSRKKSVFLVFFLSWLNLFSFNLTTSAEFLYFRAFEGKTILACTIMPMVFLLFLKIAKDQQNRNHWITLFLVVFGSFGLNMSSIYMLPFELSICFIPLALSQKSFSLMARYAACLLPCLLYGAAYLATKHLFYIYT
ncbi:MAG: hypothetical protein HFH42_02310 [Lachnospiraceae bacterium]|jgi:hypothetical protein|nr:hypothetical protein [Lachnospiraceae bacterium]